MQATRILAAALGILVVLSAAGASAAARRGPHGDRHPGHHPRASIATYTVPARGLGRVLRTAHARPRPDAPRFAQAGRRHLLMRGS